jgi:hypothetical protein
VSQTGTQKEKLPGWLILRNAASEITGAGQKYFPLLDDEVSEGLVADLGINCVARTNEVIPEEHLEEVLDEVAKALCAIGKPWDATFVAFFVSHEGIDGLAARVEALDDWGVIRCTCGDCAGITIAPLALVDAHNEKKRLREERQRQIEEQMRRRGPIEALFGEDGILSLFTRRGSRPDDRMSPETETVATGSDNGH